MHFIKESFHRKPLESKNLVYCRGATAVLLGLSFIGFCGYLISQVLNSRPILQFSTEIIDSDEMETIPNMILCSGSSGLTIVTCGFRYESENYTYVPNCHTLFRKSYEYRNICYFFEQDDRSAGPFSSNGHTRKLLEVVFYWKLEDLLNISSTSPSVPSIELSLYNSKAAELQSDDLNSIFIFSKFYTLGNNMMEKVSSLMNYSLEISYHSQQYRFVKRHKLATVLGLKPEILDYPTYVMTKTSTPLQLNPPSPDVVRELYDGMFSLRRDGNTIDIKTEILQHNILSSIGIAGGGYSVLTGIYVLLFGMSKVSPWGVAHVIPMYVKRKKQSRKTDEEYDETINEKLEDSLDSKKGKRSSINDRLLPHILGARNIFKLNSLPGKKFTPLDPTEMSNPYSNVSESISQEASFMLPTHIDIDESNTVTKSVLLNNKCETSSKPNNIKENQDSKELIELRKETAMLATEMKNIS